jgi:predicted helicase
MEKKNTALVCSRQTQGKFRHVFIADTIIDFNLTGTAGSYGSGYLFPLYLYKPEQKKKKTGLQSMMMFEPEPEYGSEGKKPNIASTVFEQLEKTYKRKPTPEQILYYCYAILYSNAYREKYAEFLKIDFPRIPITNDYNLFLHMSALGHELCQLHLLQGNAFREHIAKFRGNGDSVIEKPVFDAHTKCLYLNKTQYFEGITQEVWEYHIGGYQVLKKYLDSRKGRALDPLDDFFKIITAISKTINLQMQIDTIFESIENATISFQ